MADTDDKTREAGNGSPFGTCPKCNSPRMEAEPGSPFIGNSRILSTLRRFSGRNNGGIMPGGPCRIKCRDCGYTTVIILR